jgi:hypothetical protein
MPPVPGRGASGSVDSGIGMFAGMMRDVFVMFP